MKEEITEINKDDFFRNWEEEQLEQLGEEKKEEIITFFVNRRLCFKRDNYECRNELCLHKYSNKVSERKKDMSVHHLIPKRDFKENPTLIKRLGYEVHDLINLVTLCKKCHRGYEKAKSPIEIDGQEYKLEAPIKVDWKSVIKEGKQLRRELKRLGEVGWGKLTEEERLNIICLLMKWLSGEIVYELYE